MSRNTMIMLARLAIVLFVLVSGFLSFFRLVEGKSFFDSFKVPASFDSSRKAKETTFVVKDYIDMSYTEVQNDSDFGKNYNIVFSYEYSSKQAKGIIFAQDPSPNKKIKKGDTVTLYVSLGNKIVTIDDVSGMTKAKALSILENANGFKCSVITEESYTVEKGFVIRTDPPIGSDVEVGSAVTLYVSSGSPTIGQNNYVSSKPTFFGNNDVYDFAITDFLIRMYYDKSKSQIDVEIVKYTGDSSKVVVPTKVNGFTVTEIGDEAFRDCKSVTTVELPLEVKTIGYAAFQGCASLTKVSIPDSVTDIGYLAFYRLPIEKVYFQSEDQREKYKDLFNSDTQFIIRKLGK